MLKTLDGAREVAVNANRLAADGQLILATPFEGGRFGSAKLAVLEIANELGIADGMRSFLTEFGLTENQSLEDFLGGTVAAGQVQRALGNAMVVNLAGSFPGNLNQTEIDILQDAAMGIGKSPEANELLAATLRQIAERQNALANGLTKFAQDNQNMNDFELKLALDQEEIRLTKQLDDADQNPQLAALIQQHKDSGLAGAFDAAGSEEADTPEPPAVPYSVASTYTTTSAIEADYSKLQDDYPGVFPDLPPADPNNNNRQQALERVLAFLQGIQQ